MAADHWEYTTYQVKYARLKEQDRWGWSVLISDEETRSGSNALLDFLTEMGREGWELAAMLPLWWREGGYGTDFMQQARNLDVALLVLKRAVPENLRSGEQP